GDRVQTDRCAELLRACPKRIVDLRAVGLVRRRRAPDHRALETELHAAFQLRGPGLGIIERDHGKAGHALRRMSAVCGQPVVVDAEALLLEPGVLEPEDAEAERGIEHVGFHTVPLVVLQALRRIPAARPRVGVGALGQKLGQLFWRLASRQTDADGMRGIAFVQEVGALETRWIHDQPRRPVAISTIDALDPEAGRLTHVGISGDQLVVAHVQTPYRVRTVVLARSSPRSERRGVQSKMMPPSTLNDWPVMLRASGEARNTARAATSSGSFGRPSGMAALRRRSISSTVTPSEAARTRRFASDSALSVVPGQIAFTLMLCWASWSDAMRVMLMTAPLEPA